MLPFRGALAPFLALALVACAQAEGIAPTPGGTGGSGGGSGGTAGVAGGASDSSVAGGGGSGGTGGGTPDASFDAPADSPGDVAQGDSGTDGGACSGVTCNTPPASSCAGNDLKVYDVNGACSSGACSYASSVVTCPNGCASGSCVGDPCIGKTCASPPANACSDASHLRVYQSPGTCDTSGTCQYQNVDAFCPFGCIADVCQGDPCVGMSCTTPPPSFCKDASYLTVYDSPGTCTASASSATCGYPTSHDVYCAFGCNGTQCTNDPCAGKTCNTPPAANCKDANTARTYASSGTCSAGACSYSSTDIPCLYGCVNGVCKDCQIDGNCGTAKYCQSGVCSNCDVSQHCGLACQDCTTLGNVCSGGQCVQCIGNGLCGSGKYCSNNNCVACADDAHCGASCVACGAGTSCDGTTCAPCIADTKCGPTCAPCGGSTPYCLVQGSTSKCAECLGDLQCTGGYKCDTSTGTCHPPCPTTLTSAFTDNFATPSSSSWTSGTDVAVNTSRWRAYTTAHHGVRVNGGLLEITSDNGGGVAHGQGYAYVPTDGAGSAYDNQLYNSTLKSNTGQSVVWTLNMHRDNPESTSGGFNCSSTSSQNDIMVGLAYVLATDARDGLNSSAGTCSSSAAGIGYAVVLGGSQKIRLVRFSGGLRNGALVDLVASSNFTVSNYFSVRVTYNATNDLWTLEARSDGSSAFADPAAGSYSFTGTATDATYVSQALGYSGPYFQTGCCCLCSSVHTARFDNVSVGLRCAP